MNFVVAAAVLGAAMLSFVGEASAQQAAGSGSGTVIKMCECRGSCKLVTSCLLNYCYSETICDDCANCRARAKGVECEAGTEILHIPIGQCMCDQRYRPTPVRVGAFSIAIHARNSTIRSQSRIFSDTRAGDGGLQDALGGEYQLTFVRFFLTSAAS
jgi:hypothetical protein